MFKHHLDYALLSFKWQEEDVVEVLVVVTERASKSLVVFYH
jgi:hypothetical protein